MDSSAKEIPADEKAAASLRSCNDVRPRVDKLAVKVLVLPDGTRLRNQVLAFDAEQRVVSCTPLTSELPFCTWHRGEYVLDGERQ